MLLPLPQETELFEIIEKLQVSPGGIDLPRAHPVVFITAAAFVHQGSRIDEQRCEFPLPLRVSLVKKQRHYSTLQV